MTTQTHTSVSVLSFVPTQFFAPEPTPEQIHQIEVDCLHRAAQSLLTESKSGVLNWVSLMATRLWLLNYASALPTRGES